jgi:hypothetical protein
VGVLPPATCLRRGLLYGDDERACALLDLSPVPDPINEILVTKIVELSKTKGDPDLLCDKGLRIIAPEERDVVGSAKLIRRSLVFTTRRTVRLRLLLLLARLGAFGR